MISMMGTFIDLVISAVDHMWEVSPLKIFVPITFSFRMYSVYVTDLQLAICKIQCSKQWQKEINKTAAGQTD